MPERPVNNLQPTISDSGTGERPIRSQDTPQIEGYEITGQLGEGGMGVVWRAVQLSTGRAVALKLLGAAAFGSQKARARFEREVELTARLEHPNIPRLYDSSLRHGVYCYAMELIEGVALDKYVENHHLAQRQILELMRTVCEAVQHAHQRGVIHRDLKPSNILVTPDGQPRVLDFGLAKTFLEDDAHLTISVEGQVAGTPVFMSPEQAAGRQSQLDTRTDVYTLGVILFHLLTGQFPHDPSGAWHEVTRRICEQEIKRPREITKAVDRELEALLLKALARDPQGRYASAAELAQDINNYLSGEPLAARTPSTIYFLGKRLRKYRVPVTVGSVLVAVLLGVVVVFVIRLSAEKNRVLAERNHAEATLAELRRTAPAFYQQAQSLIDAHKFGDALVKISYAISLIPENAAYHCLRGNILQVLLRLPEARVAYAEALRLDSSLTNANENLKLCDKLIRDNAGVSELPPKSCQELLAALTTQQRTNDAHGVRLQIQQRSRLYHVWEARLKGIFSLGRYPDRLMLSDNQESFNLDLAGVLWIGGSLLPPLKGMPLRSLTLTGTSVSDLGPLEGMRLEELDIDATRVSDLGPLKGMPLRVLSADNTSVTDLSPLTGMPLEKLLLGGTQVNDLSSLKGMSLHFLLLDDTRVTDLSPLQGMPLRELGVNGSPVSDLSPLKGMPLKKLYAPHTQISDLAPLKGMALEKLVIGDTKLSDLSPLKGQPLNHLVVEETQVSDLTPLQGMPLETLGVGGTKVGDLTPLKDMPLEILGLDQTKVSDLSPLKGMPLKALYLSGCNKLGDVGLLGEFRQLENLTIPEQSTNIEALRHLPNLKRLSFRIDPNTYQPSQTAEEFWREYDAKQKNGK